MSVVVPHIVDELHRVEGAVLAAQEAPEFPVPHLIDEYSILFARRMDQDAFVARAKAAGILRFNETDDYMSRQDDVSDVGFGVHFDFLSVPAKPWRIEAMSITVPASAPLHLEAMQGNPQYMGVFHASYKLPSKEEYLRELSRLSDLGFELSAAYQNTYGQFSYWRIEPHLPYFKPRCNLRDS